MHDLIPITYQCPSCGEDNEALVDPTGGERQKYVEDCTVCCNPNVLEILIVDGEIAQFEAHSEA